MIRLLLTSALLLLALTSAAFGQFIFDFTGTGARAQGMGNAFLAISDDASAASWNPAGLTAHSKLLLGFDMDNFSPEGTFRMAGNSVDQSTLISSVGQLSIIAPFRMRGRAFVGAFSYGRSYEEYFTIGSSDSGIYLNRPRDTTTFTAREWTEIKNNPNVINFALGTVISPQLSLGFSINIYTGQGLSNTYSEFLVPDYTDSAGNLGAQHVDLMRYSKHINDTTKYSGMNLTLGAKYTRGDLDFGLVIKTPFDLTTETDRKTFAEVTYNGFVRDGNGADGSFPTVTIYNDNIVVKYEMPWIVGYGMAYHASNDWLLAADIEYRGFSGKLAKIRDSVNIRPTQENIEHFTNYDLKWRNSLAFRVGSEYLWHTGSESFPIIPIRLGASMVPLPLNRLNVSLDAPTIEKATQYRLSAGLGVKWSQIFLDFAFSYHYEDIKFIGGPQNVFDGSTFDGSGTDFSIGFTGYL